MIRLGYEIGTGYPVDIPGDRHIAVSGKTQLSGKTTTIEALAHRSGKRAVTFITKRNESGFRAAHEILPYFQERADWQFVKSLLESQSKKQMNFEASWIIDACENARTLIDVQENVRRKLDGVRNPNAATRKKREWIEKPASGIDRSICTVLNAYLEVVLPQLAKLPSSKTLDLIRGVNVINLVEPVHYTQELDALVIRSVLERVYAHESHTVVIIPEAWKFVPQKRGSPVLLAAESFARECAASKNFMWLDSQNMVGVSTDLRSQVGVWILGVQTEEHEVRRTLALAEIGASKLRPRDIMSLKKGEFYACFDREIRKVYVQPFWIQDAHAAAIAHGEESVGSAEKIWSEQERELHPGKGAKNHLEQELAKTNIPPLRRDSDRAPFRNTVNFRSTPLPQQLQVQTQDSPEDQESDEMWKEKFEKLDAEFREHLKKCAGNPLGAFMAAQPTDRTGIFPTVTAPVPEVPIVDLSDGFYQQFKARLLADPQMVEILRQRPEIMLTIERPVLTMEDSTVKGRIALLIHGGFFAAPRKGSEVMAEFRRRGWIAMADRKSRIHLQMNEIAELGFLTIETAGYQAVAGMNIGVRGAE